MMLRSVQQSVSLGHVNIVTSFHRRALDRKLTLLSIGATRFALLGMIV